MQASHNDLARQVRASLDRLAGNFPALGIAVSGGGDSTALMHFTAEWADQRRIMVATVDHDLRPDSADEAQKVARAANLLGFQHDTLLWNHIHAKGNLQANARQARLKLLSAWARQHDLHAVLLGHTCDDQAETVAMRLARGAGVDGLAGMAECRESDGVHWIRPMLKIRRAELREWLKGRSIAWIDDPSNQNEDFDRIRIRNAISAFGVEPESLSQSADHIREARDVLAHYSAEVATGAAARNGSLFLPAEPFHKAPAEIRRRLLIAGCRWVTGAGYPPRRDATLYAVNAVTDGSRVTLDGTLIEQRNGHICFYREPVAAFRAPHSDGKWDDRWQITGLCAGQHIAALGYAPLPNLDWRGAGFSYDEAAAAPAVWAGEILAASPLIDPRATYVVAPLRNVSDLRRLLISH